jgi:hypothetical protein
MNQDETSQLSPVREQINIFKSGYLMKAPFHHENAFPVTMKSYKKWWYVLKQISVNYVLEYYKDDKATVSKGTISLESCTDIKKVCS